MSATTYKTRAGDTFLTVARRVYGDDLKSPKIRRANPGAIEPFKAGQILTVPADTGVLSDAPQEGTTGGENDVEVKIDAQSFAHWTQVQIKRSIDQISSATFSAPFEPSSPEFREAFRPLRYVALNMLVGGVLTFTGTLVMPVANGETGGSVVTVTGYGFPGVLNDCNAPISSFPIELNGLDLRQIAKRVAGFYDVDVVFDADPGASFRRVKLNAEQTISTFLTELAKQRNLVITDTRLGELLFQKAVASGSPVASLRQGAQPLLGCQQSGQNPQQYFSHLTALKSTKLGSRGAGYTLTNPNARGVFRCSNFVARHGRKADAAVAAESRYGRMLANVVTYSIDLATWRDPQGDLWAPNTTIIVEYPDAMIYQPYEFLIRDVTLEQNAESEVARLELVLPGSFTGVEPEGLPWDD